MKTLKGCGMKRPISLWVNMSQLKLRLQLDQKSSLEEMLLQSKGVGLRLVINPNKGAQEHQSIVRFHMVFTFHLNRLINIWEESWQKEPCLCVMKQHQKLHIKKVKTHIILHYDSERRSMASPSTHPWEVGDESDFELFSVREVVVVVVGH